MAFKRTDAKSLINTNRKKPAKNKALEEYFKYLSGRFDNYELRELTKDLKKAGETAQRVGKIKVAFACYLHGKLNGTPSAKATEFLNQENQNNIFEILDDFLFMW